jgi:type IV pilus assembly protein PilE
MTTRTRCNSFARLRGFTLVELMVTVVVAAILFAIAIPTYTSQIQKSRRTDARSALLDLAGRDERFFSVATNYTPAATQLGYTAFPQTIGNGYYQVKVDAPDPSLTGLAATTPSFVATATTIGGQVKDTACATMTVDHLGQHKSKDASGADSSTTCWAGN